VAIAHRAKITVSIGHRPSGAGTTFIPFPFRRMVEARMLESIGGAAPYVVGSGQHRHS